MQTVKVKSAFPQQKDGGFPLAINERDTMHETPDNPDGELYIADGEVHDVPLTVGVRAALNEGRLIEVNAKGEPRDGGRNLGAGEQVADEKEAAKPSGK